MGGDDGFQTSGSLLLDFIEQVPVKNTFIQFGSTPDTRRLKTDPGCWQFGSLPPKTQSQADAETTASQTESEPLSPVEEDIPKGPESPSSFESSLATHRVVWNVDAKKLDSKDCSITHKFTIPLGCKEGPRDLGAQGHDVASASLCEEKETEFIMWLQAEVQKKRRGFSNFSASKGKGHIHVKCNEDVELALSVEVGGHGLLPPGMPPLRIRHNFKDCHVCILPNLWDFKNEVNVNTGKVTVVLEVVPCPTLRALPLTSLAAIEHSPCATAPNSDDEEDTRGFANVWSGDRTTITDCSSMVTDCNTVTWWCVTAPAWWIAGESSWGNGGAHMEGQDMVSGGV